MSFCAGQRILSVMDRFDALADKGDERLLMLSGDALSRSPDSELQRIVAEVAATIGAPIALVSLVLKRTQFFRAQVGLPPDLAQAGATDRDVSFCQFVVRDEAPLMVQDAELDSSFPQLLVREYGVRSYLGAPLRVDGTVVGSLCAIDGRPRAFSPEHLARLTALAEQASRRLGELASARRHDAFGRALSPALEEVRNILTPMVLGLGAAEAALAELSVYRGLAQEALDRDTAPPTSRRALSRVDAAFDDLGGGLEDMSLALGRLRKILPAFEAAVLRGDTRTEAAEIVEAAVSLSHHLVKLVGGVEVPAPIPAVWVSVRRGPAVLLLSAVLTAFAAGRAARPQLEVVGDTGEVRFELRSVEVDDAAAAELVERLASELPDTEGMTLRAEGPRVVLAVQRA